MTNADHKISMEPKEFLSMANKIRRIIKILGNNKLIPNLAEQKRDIKVNLSYVAKNKILKGTKNFYKRFNI